MSADNQIHRLSQLSLGSWTSHKIPGGSNASPIWQAAIDRYYDELRKGGVRAPAIDQDVWGIHSPDDLLKQIHDVAPADSNPVGTWKRFLRRLEPILFSLNDFAAVLTLALGLNGQVAAIIWGSISLIMKFARPVLPEVLDMLEELGRALPRFRKYEQELPTTTELEDALLATYTEVIVFCAHSIAFFRNNPNISPSRNAWLQFSNDFPKVISNIRRYSRAVDEIADMMRLTREAHAANTIEAIEGLQSSLSREMNLPCHMIPYGLNLKFFGRSPEKEALKRALQLEVSAEHLKVIAIYGTGGVGKTQLALHYANTSLKLYDVVLWIPAETQIKFTQALAKFALKLGISKAEGMEDDYQSIQKVRDWLNVSGKTFLLIFDNVEDHDMLEQIWPASTKGSVIITCRSKSLAFKRTTEVVDLGCFTAETGLEVLYSLTGRQPLNEDDAAAATELCELLGCFPLAMVQISEFINERGYSFLEFLPVYKKSAEKIFTRSAAPMQYEHTLNTVWSMSIQKLSIESRALLDILAFFDPDIIPEWILSNKKACIAQPRLLFLMDDFDFGDAVIGLTRASLINRISSSKAISVHRLVQFTVFSRLSAADILMYLDYAIQALSSSFPNTWNQRSHQQGHGWASWESCSAVLPHISWLMKLTEKHCLKASDPELFSELIFRAGTYLWEKEQPTTAQGFFEYGLKLKIDPHTRNYAQACRLLGHVALDMANPDIALSAYRKALSAREKFEEPDSPPIADIYDSIACSYTELGMVSEAFEYLSKATKIHHAHNPLHMGRTEAIYTMTYLRAGKPQEALESLKSCWQLQGLTEEQVIHSRYPKHSGDIVLLARIKYKLGLREEAQQLASRTISIRRGIFGDKGPRVADSMFLVARMLEADDETVLAAKLLRAVVEASEDVVEMQGHLARSLWFLAGVEDKLGDKHKAEQLRMEAKSARNRIRGKETFGEDTNESFMNLVGWMLW